MGHVSHCCEVPCLTTLLLVQERLLTLQPQGPAAPAETEGRATPGLNSQSLGLPESGGAPR